MELNQRSIRREGASPAAATRRPRERPGRRLDPGRRQGDELSVRQRLDDLIKLLHGFGALGVSHLAPGLPRTEIERRAAVEGIDLTEETIESFTVIGGIDAAGPPDLWVMLAPSFVPASLDCAVQGRGDRVPVHNFSTQDAHDTYLIDAWPSLTSMVGDWIDRWEDGDRAFEAGELLAMTTRVDVSRASPPRARRASRRTR